MVGAGDPGAPGRRQPGHGLRGRHRAGAAPPPRRRHGAARRHRGARPRARAARTCWSRCSRPSAWSGRGAASPRRAATRSRSGRASRCSTSTTTPTGLRWRSKAAERAGGYRIRTWGEVTPEEHAPALCDALNVFVSMIPRGDVAIEDIAVHARAAAPQRGPCRRARATPVHGGGVRPGRHAGGVQRPVRAGARGRPRGRRDHHGAPRAPGARAGAGDEAGHARRPDGRRAGSAGWSPPTTRTRTRR